MLNVNEWIMQFKGVGEFFFLGLIVFLACRLTCVDASFFFKHIIFHIIYLYSTPLCPFSDKRADNFMFYSIQFKIICIALFTIQLLQSSFTGN